MVGLLNKAAQRFATLSKKGLQKTSYIMKVTRTDTTHVNHTFR